ncbi:hypothetical protein MTR_1g099560 [Medicago truncatula]|uniref:Uncharacterized protein n=1 Tax=Medicago truncatula TaxID=3880 RepID=G7IDX7_MEDTR|nr:hypothetical protein MTR_1g099560 [Medicago truncatula]
MGQQYLEMLAIPLSVSRYTPYPFWSLLQDSPIPLPTFPCTYYPSPARHPLFFLLIN